MPTAPTRVLVVEDEPDLARVMALSLQRAGFEVRLAETGSAAVQAFESLPADPLAIDLVVLDRGLPDMDGTEVVASLRSTGFAGGVLMVSGFQGHDHVSECLAAGADDVLTKPFALADLVSRLGDLSSAVPLLIHPPQAGSGAACRIGVSSVP